MDGAEQVTPRKPVQAARCRSCGAKIFWAVTETGRRMPVDAEPSAAGNLRLFRKRDSGDLSVVVMAVGTQPKLFRPHFATCEQADEWRGMRRSG